MIRRISHFKGQMAVIMTFATATLLGAMALGTDIAVMYFNWVQLQKGADAAALAGAFYLVPTNSTQYPIDSAAVSAAGCSGQLDDASKAACTYAYKNRMAVDSNNLKIVENSPSLPAAAPTPNIQVWVNRPNLPYMFGKVIGLSNYSVSAKATALDDYCGVFNSPLFPVAFDCAGTCPGLSAISSGFGSVTFGTKFGGVADASGNWEFLALNGTSGSGSNLADAIAGGVTLPELSIGANVSTDTGVKWGNADDKGWQTRLANHQALFGMGDPQVNCDNAKSGIAIPSNDPLLVTVPVADLSSCKGSCTVAVTGFAQVYLYSLSKTSSDIVLSGCFVQQPDNGCAGGTASAGNLGAIAPPSLIQ
jgi:putative Flp pilus-assembly TadE/G-like protein